MAISIAGTNGITQAEVDSAFNALRSTIRPMTTLGWNSIGTATGLATVVAANGSIFSFRNISSNLIIVRRVGVGYICTTGYTAAQSVQIGLMVERNWLTSDSGGTAIALTGNNGKYRTSLATPTSMDVRISTTAALTAGSRTSDANYLAVVGGWCPAATTGNIIPPSLNNLFSQDTGDHPLVLSQNEGFTIRNIVLGGAAGVGNFYVNVEFAEVASY